MIVGFTGTREGPTPAQHATMKRVLSALPITRFVHGAEAHSDTFAHYIVRAARGQDIPIELHPSDIRGTRSNILGVDNPWNFIFPELPPLERNRVIVGRIHGLIAAPKSDIEDNSGTWATVRYGRKLNCPIYIVTSKGDFVRDISTFETWVKPL